jgi:hypothetical protein
MPDTLGTTKVGRILPGSRHSCHCTCRPIPAPICCAHCCRCFSGHAPQLHCCVTAYQLETNIWEYKKPLQVCSEGNCPVHMHDEAILDTRPARIQHEDSNPLFVTSVCWDLRRKENMYNALCFRPSSMNTLITFNSHFFFLQNALSSKDIDFL